MSVLNSSVSPPPDFVKYTDEDGKGSEMMNAPIVSIESSEPLNESRMMQKYVSCILNAVSDCVEGTIPLGFRDLTTATDIHIESELMKKRAYYYYSSTLPMLSRSFQSVGDPYTKLELAKGSMRVQTLIACTMKREFRTFPGQEFWFDGGLSEKSSINAIVSLAKASNVSLFDFRSYVYNTLEIFGTKCQ